MQYDFIVARGMCSKYIGVGLGLGWGGYSSYDWSIRLKMNRSTSHTTMVLHASIKVL